MYRRPVILVLFDCKGCNVQKNSDFDYLIVMVAMYRRPVILVLFDCKGCNVQKNSDCVII